MTAYLDASVLMPAFYRDIHTDRVLAWMGSREDFTFSRWTVAEVSSALSFQQRLGKLDQARRQSVELQIDRWLVGRPASDVDDGDLDLARALVRVDTNLRTPDALHLAIALRNGFSMATFNKTLARSAASQGLEVAQL